MQFIFLCVMTFFCVYYISDKFYTKEAEDQKRKQDLHRTKFYPLSATFNQLKLNATAANNQLIAICKLFPSNECPIDEFSLITIPDFSITYHESLDLTKFKTQVEQLRTDVCAANITYDRLLIRFTQSISEHSISLSNNNQLLCSFDAFISLNPWLLLAPDYVSTRNHVRSLIEDSQLPSKILTYFSLHPSITTRALHNIYHPQYKILNRYLESLQLDFDLLHFPVQALNTYILYLVFEKYLIDTINRQFTTEYPNLPEVSNSSTISSLLTDFFSTYPSENLTDSLKSAIFFWLVSFKLYSFNTFNRDFQIFSMFYDKLSHTDCNVSTTPCLDTHTNTKSKLNMDKATKLKLKKELMYYLSKRR